MPRVLDAEPDGAHGALDLATGLFRRQALQAGLERKLDVDGQAVGVEARQGEVVHRAHHGEPVFAAQAIDEVLTHALIYANTPDPAAALPATQLLEVTYG